MRRTYVITGASLGIGAATTRLLREQGHRVIGLSRGGDIPADLSTPQGRIDGAHEAVRAAGGVVDAVIACAAAPATPASTVAVNFYGATEFLELLRPALARSTAPRAAVVSSMSSVRPSYPALVEALLTGDEDSAIALAEHLAADETGDDLVEAASKRALSQWVRQRSVTPRWAGAGIPLNAVAPGVVTSEKTMRLLSTPEATAYVDAMVPMPLNYHQPPEAIAHLLIWLTSPENTHCAGQTIYCDGGADAVIRGDDAWSWGDEQAGRYYAGVGVDDDDGSATAEDGRESER